MSTSAQQLLRRVIHPEVRVIDKDRGIIDYVASDETLDHYREIVRADGWRFTHFAKNSPFVDSHNYYCVDRLLGKVIDWRIEKKQLIERVQWAIDVEKNQLAQIGWQMTIAGYLRAVSVGFYPVTTATLWDNDKTTWRQQLQDLGIHEEDGVRVIYIAQEQVELSACIMGANPNALAKSGVLNQQQLDTYAKIFDRAAQPAKPPEPAPTETDQPAPHPAPAVGGPGAESYDRRKLAAAVILRTLTH